MPQKPVHQQIFLWIETIIAVRILLFAAPVLIYKMQSGTAICAMRDWFILGLGLVSLCYFIAGCFSLSGYARWRALQYAAAVITIILTVLFYVAVTTRPGVDLKVFIPGVISVAIILYLSLTKKRP